MGLRTLSLILFVSLWINGLLWATFDGFEVGSGGDSVFCKEDPANPYKGYYALDFLLTFRKHNGNEGIVKISSWNASRNRIQAIFDEKFPDLAYYFADFTKHISNFDDYNQPRIWKESPFGLVDIKDEKIIRKLPPNCYLKKEEGIINIIQSVHRLKRPEIVVYEADLDIYYRLKDKAPLQFSFLMVHEWLWDLSKDVKVIREANRFIHSTKMEELNAFELRSAFRRMGIDLDRLEGESVPICERSYPIRKKLESMAKQPCDQFKHQGYGVPLSLAESGFNRPWIGDFTGFQRMEGLNLRGNGISHLTEASLQGMQNLKYLILAKNQITLFSDRLLRYKELRVLDFSENQLSKIEIHGDVEFSVEAIDLSHNRLSALPWDFLRHTKPFYTPSLTKGCHGVWHIDEPKRYCSVDLSGNLIERLSDDFIERLAAVPLEKLDLRGNPITRLPEGFTDPVEFMAEVKGRTGKWVLIDK